MSSKIHGPPEIVDAAISFAADHGPLDAALRGDLISRRTVGTNLERTLARYGLRVVRMAVPHADPAWNTCPTCGQQYEPST